MSRDRRKHSPAFKAKVLLEVVKGDEIVARLDAKYEAHPGQIQTWKNSLLEGAARRVRQRPRPGSQSGSRAAPGKPAENGYTGSFNGKLRDECPDLNWFPDLADSRAMIEDRHTGYNRYRGIG